MPKPTAPRGPAPMSVGMNPRYSTMTPSFATIARTSASRLWRTSAFTATRTRSVSSGCVTSVAAIKVT